MRTLALALLLSSGGALAAAHTWASDAGDAPRVVSVRHALAVGDDGRTYELDGGVWLSSDRSIALAKDLERLKAENEALRKQPAPMPQSDVVGIILATVSATVSALGLFKKL